MTKRGLTMTKRGNILLIKGGSAMKNISTYPQVYNEKKNKYDIYKSNRLIESSYQLTTVQNRLIYMAMTKLKKIILDKNTNIEEVEIAIKSANFDMIKIDVNEYKQIFNIKSNKIYQELESIANSLYEEEIYYINPENHDFGRTRWLTTCEYDKEQKGIKIEFNHKLIRDLLIFRGGYTKMSFNNFVDKLKSKHSFRIYELCRQYLPIGHRDFYIEDFKFKLRIFNTEYTQYSDLKRRVIKKAINEINKYTDLYLEFAEIEKNKKTSKVEKIRFIIREQKILKRNDKQKQISIFENNEVNMTIDDMGIVGEITRILEYPILLKAEDANDIYMGALFGIDTFNLDIGIKDYMKQKKVVVDNYAKSKKNKINYIGAFIKALRENWTIKYDNIPREDNWNYEEQRKYDGSDGKMTLEEIEKKLLGWS